MAQPPSWQIRVLRIVLFALWAALLLGIIGSAADRSLNPAMVVTAAVLGGLFVTASTFLTVPIVRAGSLPFELMILSGVILTAASVTVTGDIDSPFILLAITPSLLASVMGSTRMGITTSLLSAALVTAVSVASSGVSSVLASAGVVAIFPLLALVVSQIRTLLTETEERAVSLERASAEAEAEVVRLKHANDLLHRLTDVYAEGRANPVEIGRYALEAIVDANPGSYAVATLLDTTGPVVVARIGTDSPDLTRAQLTLGDGETTSGVVSLGTKQPLSPAERKDIDRLLRPVGVSFANALLLQEIARTAVKEERSRLARELHDEVGPALAALGLALDAAQLARGSGEDGDLSHVRDGLQGILEDIRNIIADLRAEEFGSLLARLTGAASELSPPPHISLDIHELRPPRSTAARQIVSILTEALRNAHRHAGAAHIELAGTVDRESVSIEVRDDGVGFDPERVPEGHYGLMGMRERANRIGATIDIDSGPTGTILTLEWKEMR